MGRIAQELRRRWTATRLALAGRVHQYPEINSLHRFLNALSVDAVIDVGANAGQYARMLRRDAGFAGHIFSFEPNPAVFAQLERAARGDARWHVFPVALSDRDGEARFNVMAADQFSSLEAPVDNLDPLFATRASVERSVNIPCRRLDTMIDELLGPRGLSRPLLKMDTQGHDKSVCEGASASLSRMAGVQTELAVRPLYAGAPDYREMIAYLEQRGFVPSAMFANNKGHFPLLVELDGLFIRGDLAGPLSA